MFSKMIGFLRSRLNSYQKIFTILGCILGLGFAIGLVAGGIAAIPFTGGASLLPAWIGTALFILVVTGSFGSAGKYIGMSIDTILSDEKPNNEKIATVAGCIIGAIVSILAIPLNYLGVGLIAEQIAVPAWEVLLAFIPLTIGMFGSACSYIGKSVDALTNEKTIFDVFKKNEKITSPPKTEPQPDQKNHHHTVSTSNNLPTNTSSHAIKRSLSLTDLRSLPGDKTSQAVHDSVTSTQQDNKKIVANKIKPYRFANARSGIQQYLCVSREDPSHLGFFARHFDPNRGIIRAEIFLKLYSNTVSDFQKTVILYALLSSYNGTFLKEKVCQALGFKDITTARKTVSSHITQQVSSSAHIRLLNDNVISKIVALTNTNKTLESGCYQDAMETLNLLTPRLT